MFHTDAVQAPGHVSVLDAKLLDVDFMSLGAHKFHGPVGIGILYTREATSLRPLFYGGHQQGNLRPGTEPVGLAVAMADALEDVVGHAEERIRSLSAMTQAVWKALAPFIVAGVVLPTGPPPTAADRVAHHVSFCVRDVHRDDVLKMSELRGLVASGGSACSAESTLPSNVLVTIGIPNCFIHGSIRLSFSHTNTQDEVVSVVIPALQKTLSTFAR